jgi:signal transduction histidine kinase
MGVRVVRELAARPLDLAVIVLALVGFVTAAVEAVSVGRPLPAVPVQAVFVAVALAGFPLVQRRRGRYGAALRTLYIVVLFLLGFASYTTVSPTGSTLLLLVVVAQAVLLLPLWAAAIVTALVPLVHVGMALGDGLRNGFGTLAAAAFTAVITELLRREHRSRVELAEAHRRLQDLAAQAEQLATAQERNRVARDIHDGLGHHLTVVQMQLQAARALLPSDPARTDGLIGQAQEQTVEALAEVRRSVAALREPRSRGGLETALRALAAETSAAGIETRLAVAGQPRDVPPEVEEALYRAAEEGLTNVRKHAGAAHARIVLEYGADRVRVEIHDDGTGLAPSGAGGGYGLVGVRERVARLDGTVDLGPAPEGGVTLAAEVRG